MSLKIMAVDDEPEVLKLFKALVEPLGIEVLAVVDSRIAAERVDREKFDGVFVDARMPHLDGFELTKRIRASRSNSGVPIVMLTGADDVETMRRAFKAGVTCFLGKPFNAEKLRSLLHAMRGAMLREKRRYARLPFRTIVNCTCGERNDRNFKSGSLNIGEGGMLLKPSGGLDVGQEVDLKFMLPQVPRPLNPRAKVIRKEPQDVIAVKFIALTPEDRGAILGYISGLVRA